jgi:uncharacterized protein YggE
VDARVTRIARGVYAASAYTARAKRVPVARLKRNTTLGGQVMSKRIGTIGVLVALLLTLTTRGKPIQAATGSSSTVAGGGGVVLSTGGQAVEGLVVVGTGTAIAEPEIAVVVFGVELRGDDPAALVDEAAQKIDGAIAAAEKLGVAGDDIRTTGYNLWVESVYNPESGTPTGEVIYHAAHHVQVTLRDLDKVGDLLAAVVEAGANSVSGVSFTVEEPDALVEQARQEALENAAAKAAQMADGLDITLGKPVLVMETSGGYPMTPVMVEWGVGGGGGGVAAPSIDPGSFAVSVSVQVIYQIQ